MSESSATQIAVVVKDLIETLMLWNGQASAGLDVKFLGGLRDELVVIATPKPRFPETFCSACGKSLGPGNAGVSHCGDHK